MYKLESSEKDESRAQSADSSEAYRKRRAFNCCKLDEVMTELYTPSKTIVDFCFHLIV